MVLHYIVLDYYQMVEYTATIHILYGVLEMAKRNGLENVYVHLFLDGRDTAPTSGKGFIEELLAKMNRSE